MRVKSTYLYLALFLAHVLVALVAFQHFWQDPHGVLFSDIGDGLKNIFTLTTYVKEPITAEGIFKYNSFQYPFGDYVYYTDNTPLFSIPFRWICHHVVDLSAHTMVVLYSVVILNIILCGLLLYHILRRFTGENYLSFIMAVILPWANMQVLRIWVGHNAFSFTSFILLAIILMMQWHKHSQNRKKQVMIGVGMSLLSFIGFLAQGYYLAILTLFSCGMLFVYGFYFRRESLGKFSMMAAVGVAVLSVCLVMATLGLTDGYLHIRPESATGYDWMEMKTRFTALFSRYQFQRIFFPVSVGISITESEQAAYLGNVGLYACLAFGVVMLFSRQFRVFIAGVQKDFFADPLKVAVFLAAVAMLSISFGEHYYTEFEHVKGLHIVNILNPLFYVHLVTKRIEQFRALERFIWPFFFVFNIWVIYMIVAVYREYGIRVKAVIVAAMLLLGCGELLDFVREMRYKTQFKNVFSRESLAQTGTGNIQFHKYQSILPIPFYSLGAEHYDYNISDDEAWGNFTFRLAVKFGLPLMACKMSRTPLVYNRMLLNLVAYDSMDSRLRAKLTEAPVLVAVNKRLLTDKTGVNIPTDANPAKLYAASLQFADRNHLQAIDSADGILYYEWYPPKK